MAAPAALAGCGAKDTRDILADIYKSQKLEAKSYDEVKANSTSDSEITCTATVTFTDGEKAEIDYLVHTPWIRASR